MSQYRVTIAFRGRASIDVDAASVAEAEEKALERWEGSEIVRASESSEVLSLKAREGGAPAVKEAARPVRAVTAPPVIDIEPGPASAPDVVEVEAEVLGSRLEAPDEPAPVGPPAPSPWRRWWPYLWLLGWLYAMWAVGQYATR